MDTHTLWQIVLADLELQVGKPVFQTFLSQTKLLSLTDKTATIGINQPMFINLIEKRYYQTIKKTLDTYTKIGTELVFTTMPSQTKKTLDGPLFTIKLPSETTTFSAKLNPDYTFENFAVSSSNQMAYAATTAVAKKPGVSYNPLFLYGGVGVGKTHLMQAIAHALLKNRSQLKLIYCTGEDFTNGIIEAISNKTTASFKKKYRRLDVLLIDDIQFIAGKNAVQEEFFHTFNAVHQTRGQIVLTSDRPPEEITKLEERLRSRFEGGLTIDIGPPDFELRCAILLIKAKQRGIDLPIELAKLIAANIENTRRLEGIFIRVFTEAQTSGILITEELVKKVLKKTIKETPKKTTLKPEEVISAVASYYQLKISQLKGDRRDRSLARPRQILYYLLKSELNMPLIEIGEFLGGRDHTTILYGIRKINDLISADEKIREDILGIKSRVCE